MGIPRVVLTRLMASGQLERAARGLYRLPDGVALQAYGVAKTVANCFEHRHKIGMEAVA